MLSLLGFFVEKLSKTSLVTKHAFKAKFFLMIYPIFVITHFNHWLVGIGGFGAYVFVAGGLSIFFEDKLGFSYFLKNADMTVINKIESLKIIILFILSIACIFVFAKVDPIKLLYISGRY